MKNKRILMIIITIIIFIILLSILYLIKENSTRFKAEDVVPYSAVYYPEDLINWDLDDDDSGNLNVATKELVSRKDMPPINETANSDTKIMALAAMNPSTLGNISNGSGDFEVYNFSHWQYIDSLVMWGGSAQEGIIVPPSAYVTDAAHQNGVKVYGTIFFPPEVYGGDPQLVRDIMQKDDAGNYIIADSLLKMCQDYNFDGWFINQETEGLTQAEAEEFQKFVQYLYDNSSNNIDIVWYDSMLTTGEIDWQNELNKLNAPFIVNENGRVSSSMFLNFWWDNMTPSLKYANEIGINPYDIYAGIDVEAEGTNTEVEWDGLFKAGSSEVSLGIYRPDTTFKNASTFEEYEAEEIKFWGDNGEDSTWPGIAHYIVGKTPIIGDGFETTFNTGNGKKYAVDGEVVSEEPWNNLSLQDILPSWTWKVQGEENINIKYDYDDPYYGGSSLKIESDFKNSDKSTIDLYATDLQIYDDTIFNITYKQSAPLNLNLLLTFNDGTEKAFNISDSKTNVWVTKEVNLNDYKKKTINKISVEISKDTNGKASVNLGQIIFRKLTDTKEINPVKKLKIDKAYSNDNLSGNIRFSFNSENEIGTVYEFYKVEGNTDKYIGSTLTNYFYVDDLKRNGSEDSFKIKVIAKNIYGEIVSDVYEFNWPKYPDSEASFEVDKTYVSPGEEIYLINNSASVATDYEWTFEGANKETSQDENPIISYDKEGIYSITLKAYNEFTSDTYTVEDIITVSDDAKDITNLATKEDVSFEATGSCSDTEAVEYAFDNDLSTKWCDNGDEEIKGFTIKLNEPHLLTGFEIDNASMGGEGSDYNTKSFVISLSTDGENYEEVYTENNNIDELTTVAIKPYEAQYIKVDFNEPTQNSENVTRIYEFKVFGL